MIKLFELTKAILITVTDILEKYKKVNLALH